jgi:hypothetical protein
MLLIKCVKVVKNKLRNNGHNNGHNYYLCCVKTLRKNINAPDSGMSNLPEVISDLHKSGALFFL